MNDFRVNGFALVKTTYLNPPHYDFKVRDLYLTCDNSSLSHAIVDAIVFAVENNVRNMTIDGTVIERV